MDLLRKTETYIYADRDLLVHNIEEAVVEVLWHLDDSNYIVPSASHPVAPITHQVEELGQSGREWGKVWTKDAEITNTLILGPKESYAPSAPLEIFRLNAEGSSISTAAVFNRITTGTPGSGLGTGFAYLIENSANALYLASRFVTILKVVTAGAEEPEFNIYVGKGANHASTAAAKAFCINADKNMGLGIFSFGTNLAKGFGIGLGTDPTTQPADMIQILSLDYVAGDARLKVWGEAGNPVWIGGGHVLADNLVNSAKSQLIQDIYDIVYRAKDENRCLDKAGLAEGTNAATLKVGAFDFCIEGIIYGKDATDNIAMTAQPVQAVSTYCLYLVSIDAAGTIYVLKGFEQATDIAVLPPLHPSRASVGYFKIVTDGVTTFTSGTTDLGAAGITETYFDLSRMPYFSTICPDRIRGLWIFDPTGAVTAVKDRSSSIRDVTLGVNADTLSPLVQGLCPSLNCDANTGYWDTPDHDDFSFGNGISDFPFSLIFLGAPTSMTTSPQFLSKHDVTTGATNREYRIRLSGAGLLEASCYDSSGGNTYRGRQYSVALTDALTWVCYTMTYSGNNDPLTGMKVYRNGVRVDDTNLSGGTYVALENTPAKLGNYYTAATGVKTVGKARYGVAMVVADELTTEQVRRLDILLRGFANSDLN